jgi:CHAD domain-containing protein
MLQNDTLKKLTPKQTKALAAIFSTPTLTAAAQVVGVKRVTLQRWLKQEHFRRALQELQNEAIMAVSRGLLSLSESSILALQDGLDEAQPIRIRLRAASEVFDKLLKIRQLVEIEARIDALEVAINNANLETT